MKNYFLTIIILFISSISFAQSISDYTGMWKSIVKASGLKAQNSYPTYLVLNDDGNYILGIDSTDSDPMKNSSGGKWSVNDEGEIKFIPADTSAEIRYYVPNGIRYKYEFTEKDGKKIPVNMLEMDFYIEKVYLEEAK